MILSAADSPLRLPLERFQFENMGSFECRVDPRGLKQILHPLAPSKAGDYGKISMKTRIPKGARPPYHLSFYVSDNNRSDAPPEIKNEGTIYRMVDTRVGHRFQKCWINGQEVWSQDTSVVDSAIPQIVDITDFVSEGDDFEVALGLVDVVNSDVKLPGDRLEIVGPKNSLVKTDFAKFETRSYWGDISLHWGEEKPEAVPASWPWEIKLERPGANPMQEREETGPLRVEKGELLNGRWSWPVVMGVPYARGALPNAGQVTLRSKGTAIPSGFTSLSQWDDGTLKWGLLEFTLKPGVTEAGLASGLGNQQAVRPEHPATLRRSGSDEATLANGLLQARLRTKGPAPLEVFSGSGAPVAGGLEVYSRTNGENYSADWRSLTIHESTDWRQEASLEGDLKDDSGKRFGRCRLNISIFANVPYARCLFTVYNETPGVSETAAYGLRLKTTSATPPEGDGGWVTVPGEKGHLTAAFRYFEHLWPNGISHAKGGVDFQIFKAGDERQPTLPTIAGEAKTTEIWLAVTPDPVSRTEAAQFAALVETPPRLDSSRLIRESLVWGPMARVDKNHHREAYERIVEGQLVPYFANPREGFRTFGNYDGFAQNFYWNTIHTMYSLYAMTGERQWFDWAERSVQHLMDTLIRHWEPKGRRVGGQYAYFHIKDGARGTRGDVAGGSFTVRLQNPHGPFNHWQMTGDPEGKRIAVGLSDFLISDKEMINSARIESARHQGWVLIALMRAYNDTYDQRYLDHAKDLVAKAVACTDPRRGAYLTAHGNYTFKGIVPFATGILMSGIREYYEATGDSAAGELLIKYGWAVYAEAHNPKISLTAPYLDYEYSPDPYHRQPPRFQPKSWLNPGIVTGQAYGAAISKDPQLAEVAVLGWKAFLFGEQSKMTPQACYDFSNTIYWIEQATALKNRAMQRGDF